MRSVRWKDADEPKKLIGVYLSLKTLERLRVYCARKFVSISETVEKAVREFLDRQE